MPSLPFGRISRLAVDFVCLWAAVFLADVSGNSQFADSLVIPVATGILLLSIGNYRSNWRFLNLWDLIVSAGSLFIAVGVLGLYLIFYREYTIDVKLLLQLMQLTLITFPILLFHRLFWFYRLNPESRKKKSGEIPVIIYGAGTVAVHLLQDITREDINGRYRIAAFVDNDPNKIGTRIGPYRIFDGQRIAELVETFTASEIWFTMPGKPEFMTEVLHQLQNFPLQYKMVPRKIQQLLPDIRSLRLEDLIQRPEIRLSTDAVETLINNKRVLITGAAGSIGQEIVRQVLQYKPVRVVLFDQWEYGVYQLNQHYNFENVHCVLGDIRDEERLLSIMENEKPEIIFHAAAYKHVPLLETNFIEALKTNILGTATLLKSIVHWLSLGKTVGPVKLVNISTDKAVEPENIMGLSKRISELLVYNVAREFGSQDLQTVSVRFGNVLGSSGSVVPLFLEQIHKGLPLTVTHPDMERFFMTIPEAVNLVLHALTVSSGQDILALDMGKSVKILELAERIILLSGYIPHKDIKIEFTGIRPGEKMKEELFWEKDSVRTDNPYIFRSEKDLKVLNVEEFIDKTVEALENNKSLGWFKDYLRQYI